MKMRDKKGSISGIIAVAAMAAGPSWAGSYGSAGVFDATVASYSTQEKLWCRRLEENVPISLHRQLDCGEEDIGFARPAVADERVEMDEPRGLIGFFRSLRHTPGPHVPSDDDNPPIRITVFEDAPETTPPTTAESVGKWDRLGEFGVTPENYFDQDDAFRDQVKEFRESLSPGGDWSGFNPK